MIGMNIGIIVVIAIIRSLSRWAFLLYIQNFYPGNSSTCMSWSWYLAVDMQLFVACTLIVFVIRAHRRVGLGLLALSFIGSTLANIVIADVYHVSCGGCAGSIPTAFTYCA